MKLLREVLKTKISKPKISAEVLEVTDRKRARVIFLIDTMVGSACRDGENWTQDHSYQLAREIWRVLREDEREAAGIRELDT